MTTTTLDRDVRLTAAVRTLLGLIRLSIGWIFLWAFLDKLFGLGFSTPRENAWIEGGSPTAGFLGNATSGPLASFYQSLSGHAWVDWLFMIGLLGIGLGLMLGIATTPAAVSGAVLLMLMWSATLWPETNPFMDDHIVQSLVLIVLAMTRSGRYLGFGTMWERLPVVRDRSWLV
ncbi:DoxX family membrane protein [uncultured Aeromicrobium sp.]|uniref:DoxX family membrane protein n=1 Tax=uncultured Aeromicrobium sp. TaxID=337820 RepID=UPI0025EC4188|nr:DoxX family membrane protein [uncultured Aeromicrobium sp.]